MIRNPTVVRPISHQMPIAASTPRKKPTGRSKISGISAVSRICGVREIAPAVGVVERAAGPDDPLRHAHQDGVEHDRGDHLVGAAVGLEDAGQRRRQHPEQPADEQHGRHVQRRRQAQPVADPGGEDGAQQQLALGADVEQPGLHADDDGQAGEDQRRRLLQRAGHGVLAAEGALEQRAVGGERVGAVEADHHGADEQGEDDRRQWQHHVLGALAQAQGRRLPLVVDGCRGGRAHVTGCGTSCRTPSRGARRGGAAVTQPTPVGTSPEMTCGVSSSICVLTSSGTRSARSW